MATNKNMINLLERTAELIDELGAINRVLRLHITEQKRQPSKDFNDRYAYNKIKKVYKRVYK